MLTNLYNSEILVRNTGCYRVDYLKVGSAFEVRLEHDGSQISCGEWPDIEAAADAVREVLYIRA